jgi:CRP/FNR family cyclic AMP-dependent transcriptional regulator
LPSFSRAPEDGPRLGLLVLEGVSIRRLGVGQGVTAELVGAGDVLWPPEGSQELASVPSRASWKVCEPSRLAVLDRSFWIAAGRWPEIAAEIGARSGQRSDSLEVLRAITQLPRLEARLHAVLWHLADRWGRVELGGTGLPLRLSQQTLADIAGARRQSVNLALKQLLAQEAIERRPRGGWLLKHGPPGEAVALQARPPRGPGS